MSQETPENDVDLIDFNKNSPVLSRASPTFEFFAHTSDNLIDSELPVLERKLQTTDSFVPPPTCSISTVDIEDILIALDDEDQIETCRQKRNDRNLYTTSDNHVELLDILDNLDEVLNACLEDSDKNSIHKYDNFQCSDSDYNDLGSKCSSPICDYKETTDNEDTKDILKKLKHFEENYNKFLSSGFINRGFIDNEPKEATRRPLSACDIYNVKEDILYDRNATVGFVKKQRTPINKDNLDNILCESSIDRVPKLFIDSDDEIDWSWLEDVARDINSTECESSTRSSIEGYSTPLESDSFSHEATAVISRRLRDSMRRLDPLLFPSVETSNDVGNNLQPNVEATNTVQERSPIVITASAANSSRPTNVHASRSRSCDSLGAERRTRRTCSSARSRRPRSLSSSVSSISSSAESSPTFIPSASQPENIPETSNTPSTPRR